MAALEDRAASRAARILAAVPFKRIEDTLEPFATCPGCSAQFPTCLGLLAAWEHIARWPGTHAKVRETVAFTLQRLYREDCITPVGDIPHSDTMVLLRALGFKEAASSPRCRVSPSPQSSRDEEKSKSDKDDGRGRRERVQRSRRGRSASSSPRRRKRSPARRRSSSSSGPRRAAAAAARRGRSGRRQRSRSSRSRGRRRRSGRRRRR
eukprot:TRINITY_DN96102_c0_g1_i1.p1 TRINITY_DN96102_c0_g1~~TRINITY_DN96102_c0_g1_i1.p1  ORF type:complete len:208 (+),score=11.90 TRINITY_DN96102_c0_g1_i1:56-679(+)